MGEPEARNSETGFAQEIPQQKKTSKSKVLSAESKTITTNFCSTRNSMKVKSVKTPIREASKWGVFVPRPPLKGEGLGAGPGSGWVPRKKSWVLNSIPEMGQGLKCTGQMRLRGRSL